MPEDPLIQDSLTHLPPLGRPLLRVYGGYPFLFAPLEMGVSFRLLLLFVFISLGGGGDFGLSGHCVQSTLTAEAALGLLALLLGLLLRRLIGRQNQHLH